VQSDGRLGLKSLAYLGLTGVIGLFLDLFVQSPIPTFVTNSLSEAGNAGVGLAQKHTVLKRSNRNFLERSQYEWLKKTDLLITPLNKS
jgi:hypothetical protein